MTEAEARLIVARLKAGRSFATRFQEQEWGVDPLPDGRFRKWSRDSSYERIERSEETLTEDEAVRLFILYNYPMIKRMVG